MTLVYAAAFGLAFGSFANAAIDRLPRGHSLNGRSQCDACGRTLRVIELIPLLSYIVLRGRCARCHEPIGLRTFAIEAASGLAFAVAFWSVAAPVAVAACAVFVAITITAGVTLEKRGART
jgi:leader peptidase (prepilin peptidase)/N-methyltransferase